MPARWTRELRPGYGRGFSTAGRFSFGSAAGLGALGLSGCVTSDGMSRAEAEKVYGPVPDEKFPIPAVDVSKIDPKYYRRTVRYDSDEAAGTIIVDPGNYYVYRIEGDGNATRYGANVGRDGFLWSGDAYVGRKAEWPVWTPPKEMIQRQPEAKQICRRHAGRPRQSARRPHALSLSERRIHALHDLQHQRPRDDRERHYERLHRPPQPGHARPLFANAGQDEGGRPAGIGNGARPGLGAAGRGGSAKRQGRSVKAIAIMGARRSLGVRLRYAALNTGLSHLGSRDRSSSDLSLDGEVDASCRRRIG